MALTRREFMKWMAVTGTAAAAGCAETRTAARARVVVIGGGYGGATAARFVNHWAPDIDVTLVERGTEFVSCPISNLVLGGNAELSQVTLSYDGLRKRGIRVIHDTATAVDPVNRQVRLGGGSTFQYDRLIVSPGVDFIYEQVPSFKAAEDKGLLFHAWKAGPQTLGLRRQLTAMRDGGVFVLHIPTAPYRCPPGPYERVCQVADYFKRSKPKSKIIVLDSNPDITSKKGLFLQSWNGVYKGMIEYRPNSELADVDVKGMTVKLTFDSVKGDVLNIVPPQRAGDIARTTGLVTANQRWCGVDWMTMESVAVKGVHVLGDATLSAPAMPKSATMANQQAKICAEAVIDLLKGLPLNPSPMMMNTCYSFVDGKSSMHVASVHAYDAAQKTMVPVKGAGGVSPAASELEGTYAWGWAKNIWSEALS